MLNSDDIMLILDPSIALQDKTTDELKNMVAKECDLRDIIFAFDEGDT